MTARLYGVGVGPGAPDLLTLRAVRVLREANVLATPRSADGAESIAGAIARSAVGEIAGQEILPVTFPMTRDRARRRAALEATLQAIGARLAAGKTVAVVSEGDPLLYSSFIDVLRAAPERFPGVPVEVIPGVSSITAAAAAAAEPLVDGAERLAVLPARAAIEELPRLAGAFDAAVILKAGPVLPDLAAALERAGVADRAILVSAATTPREEVVRGLRGAREARGYFSLVIVPGSGREGDA